MCHIYTFYFKMFTYTQIANIHFDYGFANDNSLRARSLYSERYLQNCLSRSQTFTVLHARFQQALFL